MESVTEKYRRRRQALANAIRAAGDAVHFAADAIEEVNELKEKSSPSVTEGPKARILSEIESEVEMKQAIDEYNDAVRRLKRVWPRWGA